MHPDQNNARWAQNSRLEKKSSERSQDYAQERDYVDWTVDIIETDRSTDNNSDWQDGIGQGGDDETYIRSSPKGYKHNMERFV